MLYHRCMRADDNPTGSTCSAAKEEAMRSLAASCSEHRIYWLRLHRTCACTFSFSSTLRKRPRSVQPFGSSVRYSDCLGKRHRFAHLCSALVKLWGATVRPGICVAREGYPLGHREAVPGLPWMVPPQEALRKNGTKRPASRGQLFVYNGWFVTLLFLR